MNKNISLIIATLSISLVLAACTTAPKASNTTSTPSTPPLNVEAPKDSEILANMSLYANTKYGYVIQYPSDPSFKQFSCQNQTNKVGEDYFVLSESALDKSAKPCAAKDSSYPIELHVTTGNQTTPEYFKSVYTDFNAKITPVTFGQLPAAKVDLTKKNPSPGANNLLYTSVLNNGYTYSFQLTDMKYLETYNKMVPTFKFVTSQKK